jgi:hypothetical protein
VATRATQPVKLIQPVTHEMPRFILGGAIIAAWMMSVWFAETERACCSPSDIGLFTVSQLLLAMDAWITYLLQSDMLTGIQQGWQPKRDCRCRQ